MAGATPKATRSTNESSCASAQLDSFVDLVAFSVAPAVLLLSVGEFSPWFVPGAFAVLAAGVVRLSYFNVFGLLGGATYVDSPWTATSSFWRRSSWSSRSLRHRASPSPSTSRSWP